MTEGEVELCASDEIGASAKSTSLGFFVLASI